MCITERVKCIAKASMAVYSPATPFTCVKASLVFFFTIDGLGITQCTASQVVIALARVTHCCNDNVTKFAKTFQTIRACLICFCFVLTRLPHLSKLFFLRDTEIFLTMFSTILRAISYTG